MKKLYRVSLLLFIIGVSSVNLIAQTKAKFGHINTRAVMKEMAEYKTAEATIQSETAKMEKQLTDMKETFQKQIEAYQKATNTMTSQERAAKEAELGERSQKVQAFIGSAQQTLEKRSHELEAPVAAKLQAAITAVGEDGGFLYIFEVGPGLPVYHSSQSVDVTSLVNAKLAASTAVKAAVTAPTTSAPSKKK